MPGTVAGFALAHEKYGKAPWTQLVEPAVKLAGDGFAAPAGLAQVARVRGPAAEAVSGDGGGVQQARRPYAAGERIMLPDLARTLARIATRDVTGSTRARRRA